MHKGLDSFVAGIDEVLGEQDAETIVRPACPDGRSVNVADGVTDRRISGRGEQVLSVHGEDGAVPHTSLPTTPEQWRGYLSEYGELYLRTAGECDRDRFTGEQVAMCWLGFEPAAEQAVLTAERRLGVRFPPGFRAFLLASDGWSGVGGCIDELFPCENIAWFRDTFDGMGFIDLYAEKQGRESCDEYVAVFRHSLVIASGEDHWLLAPTAAGPDDEWPAYGFRPECGELNEFSTFAELFHASRETLGDE